MVTDEEHAWSCGLSDAGPQWDTLSPEVLTLESQDLDIGLGTVLLDVHLDARVDTSFSDDHRARRDDS
jgi:hypothetical protein